MYTFTPPPPFLLWFVNYRLSKKNVSQNLTVKFCNLACTPLPPPKHCCKCNHEFDWDSKKVLDFENNLKTRTIKGYIYSEKNKLQISRIYFKTSDWKQLLQESVDRKNNQQNSMSPCWSARAINQSISKNNEHFDPPYIRYILNT